MSMFKPDRGSQDERLSALFRAYREACPDPECGPNFMPQLWQRIEARQTSSRFLGRLASGFVTAAAALTLMMAAYIYLPSHSSAFYSETYVEALAGQSVDAEFFDIRLDSSDTAGIL